MQVIKHASPNFNERRLPLSMLVLHYTGMETGEAAIERLADSDAGVSAHYVVEETGRIIQMVAEDKRAWHAGKVGARAGGWCHGGAAEIGGVPRLTHRPCQRCAA